MTMQVPKTASWMLQKILALRQMIQVWSGWEGIATSENFLIHEAYKKMLVQGPIDKEVFFKVFSQEYFC